MSETKPDDILEGTTRKVFRFVHRQRKPVGIHDIQRGLGLSSPSVAHYHVGKLLKAGLLKEDGEGYTVDKTVFENMIRIRKTALPLQTAYAAFFLTALLALVTIMRPNQLSSTYVFAVAVALIALIISSFEAYKVTRAP
ncbi:MAG: winged helix-turn-helix domain-containing protein [Nitrososphaerales archaeon]